jgi:hypothetical protein
VAVSPAPLSLAETWPVVFTLVPSVELTTFTLNVQDPPAASVPPDSATAAEPAVAVMVPPPHEPVSPLGVATVIPDGKVSVNATPVRELPPFGLPMVKLRLVAAPALTEGAPNDLEIDGGPGTVRVADAAAPVPSFVELIGPVVLV